jgi:enoyl-CoA hydratase/carnithine racemase
MSESQAVVGCQRLDGHVALVTLNRPEVRNAVNCELAQALEAIVLGIEADPDVWTVVLTGAIHGLRRSA